MAKPSKTKTTTKTAAQLRKEEAEKNKKAAEAAAKAAANKTAAERRNELRESQGLQPSKTVSTPATTTKTNTTTPASGSTHGGGGGSFPEQTKTAEERRNELRVSQGMAPSTVVNETPKTTKKTAVTPYTPKGAAADFVKSAAREYDKDIVDTSRTAGMSLKEQRDALRESKGLKASTVYQPKGATAATKKYEVTGPAKKPALLKGLEYDETGKMTKASQNEYLARLHNAPAAGAGLEGDWSTMTDAEKRKALSGRTQTVDAYGNLRYDDIFIIHGRAVTVDDLIKQGYSIDLIRKLSDAVKGNSNDQLHRVANALNPERYVDAANAYLSNHPEAAVEALPAELEEYESRIRSGSFDSKEERNEYTNSYQRKYDQYMQALLASGGENAALALSAAEKELADLKQVWDLIYANGNDEQVQRLGDMQKHINQLSHRVEDLRRVNNAIAAKAAVDKVQRNGDAALMKQLDNARSYVVNDKLVPLFDKDMTGSEYGQYDHIARADRLEKEAKSKGYTDEDIAAYSNYLREKDYNKLFGPYLKWLNEKTPAGNPAHPVAGPLAAGAVQAVTSPMRGIARLLTGAAGAEYDGTYADTGKLLTDVVKEGTDAAARNLEENIGGKGGKIVSKVYQYSLSAAESFVMGATMGPATSVVMGLNATADSYDEALNRGMSQTQAVALGITSGIFEALFEYISLDKIKIFNSTKLTGFKGRALMLLKSSGVEASEEVFTDVANEIADLFIGGELSNYNAAIARGMTPEEYAKQFGLQLVDSAVGGAFSGAAFGVASAVSQHGLSGISTPYNDFQTGKAIKQNGGVTEVVSSAKASENKRTQRLGTKLEEQLKGGKTARHLTGQVYNRIQNENIHEAAKQRAIDLAAEQGVQMTDRQAEAIATAAQETRQNARVRKDGKRVYTLSPGAEAAVKDGIGKQVIDELTSSRRVAEWAEQTRSKQRDFAVTTGAATDPGAVMQRFNRNIDKKTPAVRKAIEEGKTYTLIKNGFEGRYGGEDGATVKLGGIVSVKDGKLELAVDYDAKSDVNPTAVFDATGNDGTVRSTDENVNRLLTALQDAINGTVRSETVATGGGTIFTGKKMTVEAANVALANFDPSVNTDVDAYVEGIYNAYKAGSSGMSLNGHMNLIRGNAAGVTLSQLRQAWRTGAAAFAPKPGVTRIGDRQLTDVQLSTLSAIDGELKKHNIAMVAVDHLDEDNGYYQRGSGVIVVALDADYDLSMTAAWHEAYHMIKTELGDTQGAEFVDATLELFKADRGEKALQKAIDQKKADYAKQGVTLTDEQVREEVAAQYFAALKTVDSMQLGDAFKGKRNLLETLRDALKGVMEAIRKGLLKLAVRDRSVYEALKSSADTMEQVLARVDAALEQTQQARAKEIADRGEVVRAEAWEADEMSDAQSPDVAASLRTEADPKKTNTVYKLMRLGEDGNLYPLFIDSASGIEVGKWYDADSPDLSMLRDMPSGVWLVDYNSREYISLADYNRENGIKKTGKLPGKDAINRAALEGKRWVSIEDTERKQTRYSGETRKYNNIGINGSGSVSTFAMRPGWHAGSLPTMRQIGKGANKDIRDDRFVWVRGRVSADTDYQAEADANPDHDIPTHIPTNGFYMKATNADKVKSQADRVGWYVAGSFIADEIIGDMEARSVIDEWNAAHPGDNVEYDYSRENGRIFDAESMSLVAAAGKKSGDVSYSKKISETVQTTIANTGVAMIDAETESAAPTDMHSLRTWNESEYVQQREETIKAIMDATKADRETVEKYVDDIDSIAYMIANDRARLDYDAAPGRSVFVSNAEYGGSIDFSTLCAKRRLLTGTFQAIQNYLKDTVLTPEDVLKLRNMMKDRHYVVNCGLCYVEGSRAQMGVFAKQFIERYQKHFPDAAWVPDLYDVNTPDGVEQMRLNHPDVYEQYEKFWNNHGKLGEGDSNLFASQQKPKLYQTRTDYKGEILDFFKSSKEENDKVKTKNDNGGLRIQSFSDFELPHMIDMMQVIMDMYRVGLAGQAYTKVPEFAWALGNTGLKINLSLIAKGLNEDGTLEFDDTEGMPHEEAFRIRNAFSKNVGTILVVFDDAQLKAAMADPQIDFIIPFHRSQWKKAQYGDLGLPTSTKDFTRYQNEKYAIPKYHEFRGRQVRDKAANYMPNTYWDFNKSGKENAQDYLDMCKADGKRPKFYQLLDKHADGSYSMKEDGSTDGYWKLLIDFKMYDNDGVGAKQEPVKPIFNMGNSGNADLDSHSISAILADYEGGHQNFPVAQDVVKEFIKYKTGEEIKESDVMHSRKSAFPERSFTYQEFLDKKEVHIVDITESQSATNKEAKEKGKKNAQKIGTTLKDGTVSVHVDDTNTDVVIGSRGLVHSLGRRLRINAKYTEAAGLILKNSILINELIPRDSNADVGLVYIGVARTPDNNLHVVESVVNRYTSSLISMDVLYSINGNEKGTGVHNAPWTSTSTTGSTISITDFLDFVNSYFPDILPDALLKHYGHITRPTSASKLGLSVMHSRRVTDARDRFEDETGGGAVSGMIDATLELLQKAHTELDRAQYDAWLQGEKTGGRMKARKGVLGVVKQYNDEKLTGVSNEQLTNQIMNALLDMRDYDFGADELLYTVLDVMATKAANQSEQVENETRDIIRGITNGGKYSIGDSAFNELVEMAGGRRRLNDVYRRVYGFTLVPESEAEKRGAAISFDSAMQQVTDELPGLFSNSQNYFGFDTDNGSDVNMAAALYEMQDAMQMEERTQAEELGLDKLDPNSDEALEATQTLYERAYADAASFAEDLIRLTPIRTLADAYSGKMSELRQAAKGQLQARQKEIAAIKERIVTAEAGLTAAAEESRQATAEAARMERRIENLQGQLAVAERDATRARDAGDAKAAELEAKAEKLRGQIAELRDRLQKEKAKVKRRDAALVRAREDRDARLQAQREYYQDMRRRQAEKRRDTASRKQLREKLVRDVKWLRDRLEAQTDQKHIPEALKKVVTPFVEAFLTNSQATGDRAVFTRDSIDRLLTFYERLNDQNQTNEDNSAELATLYGLYDADVAEKLKSLKETLGGRRLSELTATELRDVDDVIANLRHIVRDANSAFVNGKRIQFSESGQRFMQETRDKKKNRNALAQKIKTGADGININMAKPIYLFKEVVGGEIRQYFDAIREAQNVWAFRIRDSAEALAKIKEKYHFKDWNGKNSNVTFTLEDGTTAVLTKQAVMQIYATYKREMSLVTPSHHLTEGGIVLSEDLSDLQNKNAKKIKKGDATAEMIDSKAHPLTEKDLRTIFDTLTDDQRGYVDECVAYLSGPVAGWGNEASMELHGYKKFGQGYYFPFQSSDLYLRQSIGVGDDARIKNKGFTKALTPGANNPIVITGFDEVLAKHIGDMASYSTLAVPLENLNRLLNFKIDRSNSVRADLNDTYGKAVNDYIREFLTQMNGGVKADRTEGFVNGMMGRFKRSAVALNASVMVQQPSAVARAMAMVNPQYFVRSTANFFDYKELMKYSGVAIVKQLGGWDTGTGRSTTDYLLGESSVSDRITEITGKGAEVMDAITWSHIWNAVKRETAHEMGVKYRRKGMSEEFYQRAAQRFNEVADYTQVYDSTLSRSQWMRSQSAYMKMATAFMAEPTTSYNMLVFSGQKKNGKTINKAAAVGAFVVNVIFNTALQSLVGAWRDKDDESYWERWFKKLIQGVFGTRENLFLDSELNPLNMIPFVKDIISIFEGYDVERSDMQPISEIVTPLKKLIDAFAGRDDDEAIWDFLKENQDLLMKIVVPILNLTPVPVKSLYKDVWLGRKNALEHINAAKLYDAAEYNDAIKMLSEIESAMKKLGVSANDTIFGNINTNDRQVIYWTQDNINRFKDALISWGLNPNDYLESLSTVIGMSENFNGVEIAFSPILQTSGGPVLLDNNTVEQYISALLQKAGGTDKATILSLDKEGLTVDGKKISKLIADVGATAIRTGEVMHYTGTNGALALARQRVEDAQGGGGYKTTAQHIANIWRQNFEGEWDKNEQLYYSVLNHDQAALDRYLKVTDADIKKYVNEANDEFAARTKAQETKTESFHTNVQAALKAIDDRITNAAQALLDNDFEAAQKLADAVVADGFDSDDVYKAILTTRNAMKQPEPYETKDKKDVYLATYDMLEEAYVEGDTSFADALRKEFLRQGKEEKEINNKIAGYIKSDVEDGEIDIAEAKKALLDFTTFNDKEVKEKVATHINDAFVNGKIDLTEAQNLYASNTDYSEATIKSKLISDVGKRYNNEDNGMSYEDAKKMYAELGMTDIRIANKAGNLVVQDYKDGRIASKTDAVRLYMQQSDINDADEAEKQFDYIDLTIDRPEWDLTFSDYSAYVDGVQQTGLSMETFYEYTATVKGMSGDTVSEKQLYFANNNYKKFGTVQVQKLPVIAKMDITTTQKDAIYLAYGWSAKKLEYTPWHNPGYWSGMLD